MGTYHAAKAQLSAGKSRDDLDYVIMATKVDLTARAANPALADVIGKVWDRKAKVWTEFAPTKDVIVPGRAKVARRSGNTIYWRWGPGKAAKAQWDAMVPGLWIAVPTVTDYYERKTKIEKEKNMVKFEISEFGKQNGITQEALGFLPQMFSAADPRPAAEQISDNYAHGGGFNPTEGFTLNYDTLSYPGDSDLQLLAKATLGDEELYFYECEFLAIVQSNGSFAVTRMD